MRFSCKMLKTIIWSSLFQELKQSDNGWNLKGDVEIGCQKKRGKSQIIEVK